MKPEIHSFKLLGSTRSKSKMYEYEVPLEQHISLIKDPAELLSLTIGILGDYRRFTIGENYVNSEPLEIYRKKLLFAAQFFDAYYESKIYPQISYYLLIVGAAAYYLCDLPGNAKVLINKIKVQVNVDLEVNSIEKLLYWILLNDHEAELSLEYKPYKDHISEIKNGFSNFCTTGNNKSTILRLVEDFRKIIYKEGSAREVLFVDIVESVIISRIFNSSWSSLERYTDTNISDWREIIKKHSFIKEFWPAQKLIGEQDVFKGKSAIIQMPTSAGKTKSIEIIIRSKFLSTIGNIAVIVAPFRALCSEIKEELQFAFKDESIIVNQPTDVIQDDFEDVFNIEIGNSRMVLILTPEKFLYILRKNPELAADIGLLIYDEGHQFDNGLRGVTYELLLSSLKLLLNLETQVILISAVISNAETIGDWLINNEKSIIRGNDLIQTYRTIAFSSWKTELGKLQFVNIDHIDEDEFYVPRIINAVVLDKKGREWKERLFPLRGDGKSLALYFGLKLVKNGPLAIFCGSKLVIKSILELAIDLDSRNYKVNSAIEFSDQEEVSKLTNLISMHYGPSNYITIGAHFGIFAHSNNTPQGLRHAIEFSMHKEKIKFIVCTSTLAQGVNLPIKYLLITSFYQAQNEIKVRDFHNLIGRAGRAGIFTEGTIIFTDTELYDNKEREYEKWKWDRAKKLLDLDESEPCGSTLLSLFDDLESFDKKRYIQFDLIPFVSRYLDERSYIQEYIAFFIQSYPSGTFTISDLNSQLEFKLSIIAAIEGFIMANWDAYDLNLDSNVERIVHNTLAYHIGDDNAKSDLVSLFVLLKENIRIKLTSSKIKCFSKTLLGVQDLLEIDNWVNFNLDSLLICFDTIELLNLLLPILLTKTNNKNLKKVTPLDYNHYLIKLWVEGNSYIEMYESANSDQVKFTAGNQFRKITIDNIIEICEGGFAYDMTLVIAAIIEIIRENISEENEDEYSRLVNQIEFIQKQIKYGLPTALSIAFYELGFCDRIIALKLSTQFSHFTDDRKILLRQIRKDRKDVLDILEDYPDYFSWYLQDSLLG